MIKSSNYFEILNNNSNTIINNYTVTDRFVMDIIIEDLKYQNNEVNQKVVIIK